MGFIFGGNTGETPQSIAAKRAIADAMLKQGMADQPMVSPLQGIGQIAEILSSKYQNSKINQSETAGRSNAIDKLVSALGGGFGANPPAAAPASTTAAPAAGGDGTFGKMLRLESGGDPNAVSPKGATGIAQIMPATARDPGFGLPNIFDYAKANGVQVADNSDATLQSLLTNPTVNAGFGKAYFDKMKEMNGGDERLAAASYNAGPGAVAQAGGVPNIPETQAYVKNLGLDGAPPAALGQPQVAPAAGAPPSNLQNIVAALSDGFLPPAAAQLGSNMAGELIKQGQPDYQLEQRLKAAQLQQIQHPDQVPLTPLQQQQLEQSKHGMTVQDRQLAVDNYKAQLEAWTAAGGPLSGQPMPQMPAGAGAPPSPDAGPTAGAPAGTDGAAPIAPAPLAAVTLGPDGKPDAAQQTALLARLSTPMQGLVKQLATYSIDPARVPAKQRMLLDSYAQMYDPTYSPAMYVQRMQMNKAVQTGQYAQTINSAQKVIQHLGLLKDYADALDNGNVQTINAIKNKIAVEFGADPQTNFQVLAQGAGTELAKALKGNGALDVQSMQEAQDNFKNAASPPQMRGAISTAMHMLSSAIDPISTQYQNVMGKQLNWASPKTIAAMQKLGIDTSEFDLGGQGDNSASGAAAAPAVGTVEQGFRFKGGDPSNQASWEKVQ